MRWLTLLVSLPPTPTRHRVGVWRKLKRMGAVKLKGAAWILPETTELFQWLVPEIPAPPGGASLRRVHPGRTTSDGQLTALVFPGRQAGYHSLIPGLPGVRGPPGPRRA